jgi:hypothetical protein
LRSSRTATNGSPAVHPIHVGPRHLDWHNGFHQAKKRLGKKGSSVGKNLSRRWHRGVGGEKLTSSGVFTNVRESQHCGFDVPEHCFVGVVCHGDSSFLFRTDAYKVLYGPPPGWLEKQSQGASSSGGPSEFKPASASVDEWDKWSCVNEGDVAAEL